MYFSLQEITAENKATVLALKVKTSQAGYIETVGECLAEANECPYFRPVALYTDKVLVGFAMFGFFPAEVTGGRVWLDRFLIDSAYQGQGLGRRLIEYLLTHITAKYACNEIYLSIYDNNTVGLALYQSLGFMFNGELDAKGEKVMVKQVKLPVKGGDTANEG